MSTSTTIVLESSDGETFEVEEAVALESQAIKHVIEDCADPSIPLPNVTSKILAKVIEYCKKHVDTPKSEDETVDGEIKNFDAEFVKVDQAANYLNIKSLLDLTCQTVADMIRGRTPEELRKTFNVKPASSPEEEEELRKENDWAFYDDNEEQVQVQEPELELELERLLAQQEQERLLAHIFF